ncbi:MAG: diguanylate cyclase domain-containing protein [Thermodesulfobacteriota bacterium]
MFEPIALGVERRRYPRLRLRDGAVSFQEGERMRTGRLLDIGLGGVGFKYAGAGQYAGRTGEMNIFVNSDLFLLSRVPGKVVSDHLLAATLAPSVPAMARCSVCFRELPRSKVEYLNQYLGMRTHQRAFSGLLEKELDIREERYRSIVEGIDEGYVETDTLGRIIFFNRAMTVLTGYSAEELRARNIRGLMTRETRDRVFQLYRKAEKRNTPIPIVDWDLVGGGGKTVAVEASTSFIRENSRITGFRSVLRDVGAKRERENDLLYRASHDPLTGLYNRDALDVCLSDMMGRARRAGRRLAVLFLDLDRFKEVNDRFGHGFGDELLREVARRLRAALRETDAVCRYGGDEFTVILNGDTWIDTETVAEKLLDRVSAPYTVNGRTIDFLSASIGISIYPDDGADPDALVRQADRAMYHAKQTGNHYARCDAVIV